MHVRAQAEIIDETDVYEDVNRRVLRRGGARADVATFLTMCAHAAPPLQSLIPPRAASAGMWGVALGKAWGVSVTEAAPQLRGPRTAVCLHACPFP